MSRRRCCRAKASFERRPDRVEVGFVGFKGGGGSVLGVYKGHMIEVWRSA